MQKIVYVVWHYFCGSKLVIELSVFGLGSECVKELTRYNFFVKIILEFLLFLFVFFPFFIFIYLFIYLFIHLFINLLF